MQTISIKSRGLFSEVSSAVTLLQIGKLVALPTETVYGLGVDARNPQALARLYQVKGRPVEHPVIVHLASAAQMMDWAVEIPEAAFLLAEAFWPGPLTLILKRASHVLDAVTGGQETVGLRVPNHALMLAVLAAFGDGVAAPSANRFGKLSPTKAAHVLADLGEDINGILEGGTCVVGIESTIVDCSGDVPKILRPGAITADHIAAVLGIPIAFDYDPSKMRAPGILASHYAPVAPLKIVDSASLQAKVQQVLSDNKHVAVLALSAALSDVPGLTWFQATHDANVYAQQLYATLRALDAQQPDVILVEALPNESAWLGVADRIQRAAS